MENDDLDEPQEKRSRNEDPLDEFRSTEQVELRTLETEFQLYREMQKTFVRNNNPLHFWEDNCKIFPLLSQLAFTILSVPASQLGVERHFNIGKIIMSARRANIKPEKLDETFFVRDNYNIPEIVYPKD